jgi:hypothetical protein
MSKTVHHIIKKGLVLTLLAVYLFMALPYVCYLPLHSYSGPPVVFTSNTAHLINYQTPNNSGLLLHCISKVVNENKRNAFISLWKTIIVASMVLSMLTLPFLKSKQANYLKFSFDTHPNFYLDYCSLRI